MSAQFKRCHVLYSVSRIRVCLYAEGEKQDVLQESFAYVSVADTDAGEKVRRRIRRIVFDFVYFERCPEEVANVPQVLNSEAMQSSRSNYRALIHNLLIQLILN